MGTVGALRPSVATVATATTARNFDKHESFREFACSLAGASLRRYAGNVPAKGSENMEEANFSKDPKELSGTVTAFMVAMAVGAVGISIIISMAMGRIKFPYANLVYSFFMIENIVLFFGGWLGKNVYSGALEKATKGEDPNKDEDEEIY